MNRRCPSILALAEQVGFEAIGDNEPARDGNRSDSEGCHVVCQLRFQVTDRNRTSVTD